MKQEVGNIDFGGHTFKMRPVSPRTCVEKAAPLSMQKMLAQAGAANHAHHNSGVSQERKKSEKEGTDRARALRAVANFLQHGRLRLRQISGPNGAASSVVAAEAR